MLTSDGSTPTRSATADLSVERRRIGERLAETDGRTTAHHGALAANPEGVAWPEAPGRSGRLRHCQDGALSMQVGCMPDVSL